MKLSKHWDQRSLKCIEASHKGLILPINYTRNVCPVKFQISDGSRTIAEQQIAFDTGASQVNPRAYSSTEALCKKANHVIIPGHPIYSKSRAVDVYITSTHKGKRLTWDAKHFIHVAGWVLAMADLMFKRGIIPGELTYGGNWDGDEVIEYDQKLIDHPHFQINI